MVRLWIFRTKLSTPLLTISRNFFSEGRNSASPMISARGVVEGSHLSLAMNADDVEANETTTCATQNPDKGHDVSALGELVLLLAPHYVKRKGGFGNKSEVDI